MTTADELERCRRQLRELDEQEMLLASYQRKSQQLAEETYYNIQSAYSNDCRKSATTTTSETSAWPIRI